MAKRFVLAVVLDRDGQYPGTDPREKDQDRPVFNGSGYPQGRDHSPYFPPDQIELQIVEP